LLKGLLLAVIASLPLAGAIAAETPDELPLLDRLEAVAIPIGRGAASGAEPGAEPEPQVRRTPLVN